MAVPMVSSAEGVTFEGFKRLASSFRMAGVALRDVQICLVKGRKSFCVAGAILLRRFQKIRYSFRGRRSTLDVSIVIFRGRRSALDVSCSVFFPTSLCGVLVFGCALPPRLPPRPSRPARPTHDHTHTHNLSTLCMAGVAVMALDWLWWRAWVPVDVAVAAAVGVAGVALGDTELHFAWQA